MKPRLVPNSESSCRRFLSAGFTGTHHGARLPGCVFSLRKRVCIQGSVGEPRLAMAALCLEIQGRDRQLSGDHLPHSCWCPAQYLAVTEASSFQSKLVRSSG